MGHRNGMVGLVRFRIDRVGISKYWTTRFASRRGLSDARRAIPTSAMSQSSPFIRYLATAIMPYSVWRHAEIAERDDRRCRGQPPCQNRAEPRAVAELVRKEGPHEKKDIVAWLKTRHDIGTVTANFIAAEAIGQSVVGLYADEGALLDRMYAAERKALRPLYDRLSAAAAQLGEDVEMTVCKTYVGIRRKRQFAMIKPPDK